MEMANITEIRQNASKIIQKVVDKKEPIVILQRSKPVAYIIDAAVFENMKNRLEAVRKYEKMEKTKAAIQKLTYLREKMTKRNKQADSVMIIRELREGFRDE